MVEISPAQLSDLSALTELESQLFSSDKINRRQFRYLITRARGVTVKIATNDRLLGYMVLLTRRACSNLRIYSIGIHTEAQNRGYARKFLRYAEETAAADNCRSITLEVSEGNHSAITLYESLGYLRYGRKPEYYEDGSTALLFRKTCL